MQDNDTASCEMKHHGDVCGRGKEVSKLSHIDVDGRFTVACEGHLERWREGKQGDDFTKPIREERKALPTGAVCEADHHGDVCGRDVQMGRIDVDGRPLLVCGGHKIRWRKGKRGDDFTKPISKR